MAFLPTSISWMSQRLPVLGDPVAVTRDGGGRRGVVRKQHQLKGIRPVSSSLLVSQHPTVFPPTRRGDGLVRAVDWGHAVVRGRRHQGILGFSGLRNALGARTPTGHGAADRPGASGRHLARWKRWEATAEGGSEVAKVG